MKSQIKEEEKTFVKAVEQGLADIDEGRTMSLADAKKRFALNDVE